MKRVAAEKGPGMRRGFLRTPKEHLIVHQVYRPTHGLLQAVFVFESRPSDILSKLDGSPQLRITLAILISGLICFVLSRAMTNRLKALQLTSRQLANGDLDARLQVRDQGGDETDELARDFNSMAEQLKQRMDAQKRMLSDVSHELRSPLTRLRIALALVEEDPAGGGKYLSRIEQEAERLEELISQLLSSQVRDVTMDAHIDLAGLLQSLCADANFEGQGNGKQVDFNAPSQQMLVNSSGDLLRKCFENILRNALAHTPDNSRVTVTLRTSTTHYHVSVEDQGAGVPDRELETIFDEFYRVDTARARDSGGYGLGLAIARRAIVQHRGEISAHNTGSGLAIEIVLPRPVVG